MSWIPESERDTAWYVTVKTYPCMVPNMASMSPDYIRFMGMPDSGDERTNLQIREELLDVYHTIGKMAEFFADGIEVRLVKKETKIEVYQRIIDHLEAWKFDSEGINPGRVSTVADDLIKLDNFARALYPHVYSHLPENQNASSTFTKRLGGLLSINRQAIAPVLSVQERMEQAQSAKHSDYSEHFEMTKWRPGGS